MSDTMRDAFEAEAVKHDLDLSRFSLSYSDPNTDYAWIFWQAAQSQPSPPAPQTVQEIMRLMSPYISACVDAGVNNVTGRTSLQFEADVAKVDATFKPLHAALTALVEKNHELQFALDGVNAMRRPLTSEEIQAIVDLLKPDHDGSDFEPECPSCTAYQKLTASHGIEPQQGESNE